MFKCIKGFSIELVDGNGFEIEDEFKIIDEGTIWKTPEDKDYRFIGGEVRLENDEFGWIELTKEHLEEYFEEVK